jgi:demethylmenaquinone methyltransferase/2-methoxy-6-polyprenyl-1,4-benzoquinol methylase
MDIETRRLFDANASTYDRVNTLISLGLDARWRDWAARRAVDTPHAHMLDAFAGTGLVGLRAAALGADVTLADDSSGMLAVAQRRARDAGLEAHFVVTDLTARPPAVPGAPFDAVTLVFGARYVDDPVAVVRGLASLLRPGGAFVIVDFVEPPRALIPRLAGVYFFHVLPRIASLLAGRRDLYERLTMSTHEMGTAQRLVSIAQGAGLTVTETRAMGFGLVTGLVARRDRDPERLPLA